MIVIGQHMRQSDGSHCTTAYTTIKCNGPRLVQPLVSTVCKASLPCCGLRTHEVIILSTPCGLSEVFMRECMCSCPRTYLGHQASPANTKGVSPRSTSIISASVLYSARSCTNRMHTQFFSSASFSHAVFNGDRRRPVCGPGCACRVRTVRCRHTARGFAPGLPLLSEKQTAVTMNAYLALCTTGPAGPRHGTYGVSLGIGGTLRALGMSAEGSASPQL